MITLKTDIEIETVRTLFSNKVPDIVVFVVDEGVSLAPTYSSIVTRKSDLRSSLRTKHWLSCFYLFFAKYVFIE